MIELAKKHKLIRLVTLTLDPGLIPSELDSVVYIQRVWNRFRTWIWEHKHIRLTYIRVVELQENGTAHYHLCLKECISQDEIIEAWTNCGGGHQCRIGIPKHSDPARYASKYISKALADELRKGTRVVATSQGLILFPPPPDTGWRHISTDYFSLLATHLNTTWREAWESTTGSYFEYQRPPTMPTYEDWWDVIYDERQKPVLIWKTYHRAMPTTS